MSTAAERRAQRMANPAYRAYVESVAAQIPEQSEERVRAARGLITAGRREAARTDRKTA